MKQSDLNIHVITKYFIPVTAGIEMNILNTYSVLAEKGNRITLHTSKDTLTEHNSLADEESIKGIKVKRSKFLWWGFWPKINYQQADLICLHNFNIIPHLYVMAYALALKIFGRKTFSLVLTPHGGFNPEWSVFSAWVASIKKFYHYTVGVFLINTVVDKVRAVSEWERREIIAKGVNPKKVITISNGIEDEAYSDIEKLASGEIKKRVAGLGRYIIQIGRVYPIKNYETTIRALAKTPNDLKYIIAGPIHEDGKNKDYKKSLDDLISKLGLNERVFFWGVIKGVDKYYLIKHAMMMVHMAIWESFCNVVHEGLSQGLVCIVANSYALPYLIKDKVNGYLVETRDWQTLADRINYVLDNFKTDEIRQMREKNKQYGLKDSWRNVAGRMNVLYHDLRL